MNDITEELKTLDDEDDLIDDEDGDYSDEDFTDESFSEEDD